MEYRLGRSIAQIVPVYRHIKKEEFITNKILIIMGIVAITNIAVSLLWPIWKILILFFSISYRLSFLVEGYPSSLHNRIHHPPISFS